MSAWINVEDRLPDDDTVVLFHTVSPYPVYTEHGGSRSIHIGYRGRRETYDYRTREYGYTDYEWHSTGALESEEKYTSAYKIDEHGTTYQKPSRVTHWMPMPEWPELSNEDVEYMESERGGMQHGK